VLNWIAGALAAMLTTTTTQATITKEAWGKTKDGKAVDLYTIRDKDLVVKVTTFGARIVSIETPDRSGKKTDVILGYNGLSAYESDSRHLFWCHGRSLCNRIAHGSFVVAMSPIACHRTTRQCLAWRAIGFRSVCLVR